MIIDCHCHAGRGDLLTAPWTTAAPLGRYLRRAAAAGIGHTIVFPAFHSDYAVANAELARIVASHPGRLTGFAMIHPVRDAGSIHRLVTTAVTRYGFRGVKVHGTEGMPIRELCESARAFRIPVLVDVAGRAPVIDMFAGEYPDVAFIIPHLGSFADDWRAQQQVVDQLVRHRNVFADTSGVRRFDYLEQAVRRAGPHKLLFGSDGPWLHPGVELHKVHLLGLPAADTALILGGNAQRLIFGTERPVMAAPGADAAGHERPGRRERVRAARGLAGRR